MESCFPDSEMFSTAKSVNTGKRISSLHCGEMEVVSILHWTINLFTGGFFSLELTEAAS